MRITIIFIALLAFMACSKMSDEHQKQNISVENKITENVLATEPSVYSTYLFVNNPLLGYSTMKENPLADEVLDGILPEQLFATKNSGNDFSITVNGINISTIHSGSSDTKSSFFQSLYGQKVSFNFSNNSKGDTSSVNMYIPNLVSITSPKIEEEQDLYPFCYYDNFILGWNSDPMNENGLIVIVEWNGTLISEEDDCNEYVRNVDYISDDSGKASLNPKIFDGIPDRALVYITLLRGNIVLADIDEVTYRLFGETHAILPIILIRDLN